MYYKPKFCSNCGEKIERREWKPWTSTRFCDVCESDFRLRDWLPKTVVVIGIISGVFGLGSYLQTREKPVNISRSVPASNVSLEKGEQGEAVPRDFRPEISNSTNRGNPEKASEPAKPTGLMEIEQNSPAEAVYFCGAKTQKGKPCTRLVKGGGRCWQHPGKSPMLAQDQLLAPK